ncbi:PaREP1 family protein [Pyrodictium abyssi]|uniref:Uncharacterized protein n=1 Tax=Pyrodictium abyssi TaxID=54256 RepID=A0ABN6ZJT5_9CREN|nr:hypothetical protein PABY_00890 [Pyrodictium abyssi]
MLQGRRYQAWRALTAAILALERDKILGRLSGEQRKWFTEKAVPRVPSSRLKAISSLVEDSGYTYYTHFTSTALDLHDCQYHGPDPDAELSKYRGREEAAGDILRLARILVGIIEERVKPRLEREGKWAREHEEALARLREQL